jgi:uncharacterized protein
MNLEYSPLKQKDRIKLIDALRGFALFGILIVNMQYMYEPLSQMILGAKPDVTVNHIVFESFIKFFFEGKFYVIFSMLFGFGFWIFMNKGTGYSITVMSIYRRRLLFLLLFGLAHICLLWAGDILVFYSLFGFILILFRKASDRKIVKWATAFLLIPTLLISFIVLAVTMLSQQPEAKAIIDTQFLESVNLYRELIKRAAIAYSTGSFKDIMIVRLEEYATLLGGSLFFFCPVILAVFLAGYLAARKGIMQNYAEHLPLFRKMFWWGLAIGLITSALYTVSFRHAKMNVPDGWSLLATVMHTFGGISLGLCYISGIAILFIKGKSGIWVKYFVPIGRMALTNYLLQSMICIVIFHSYGFGLYGKVEVWQGIILTVIIFTLQILFSRWWIIHFQFGPFEWLWRCLTYFKLLPLKKK